MSEIKQNTAVLPDAAPKIERVRGIFGAFRRLWRLYRDTPIGCEITASWIQGDSLRGLNRRKK